MSDHLNLLPTSALRYNRIWYRVRQYTAVWILVIIAGIAVSIGESCRVWVAYVRMLDLEHSAEPVRETQQQLAEMQRKLSVLQSRESLLAMLDRMEQPVQILGIISRSTTPERAEVQVSEMILTPHQVPEVIDSYDTRGQKTTTTKNLQKVRLKLEGLGIDDLAVARFVAGLRESSVFETVALKSSTRIESLPGERRRFSVECEFQ